MGQQCWQGRRPGAAGSGSPACARGWRLSGALLPAGAIVGLSGAERKPGTCSFLDAHFRFTEPRNRTTESKRSHQCGALPPSSPLPWRWQSAATVRRRDPLHRKAPWGPQRRLACSLASLSALAVAGLGQLSGKPGAPGDACVLPWPAPAEEGREAGARVAGEASQSGALSLRSCSPWSPPWTGAWERGLGKSREVGSGLRLGSAGGREVACPGVVCFAGIPFLSRPQRLQPFCRPASPRAPAGAGGAREAAPGSGVCSLPCGASAGCSSPACAAVGAENLETSTP